MKSEILYWNQIRKPLETSHFRVGVSVHDSRTHAVWTFREIEVLVRLPIRTVFLTTA